MYTLIDEETIGLFVYNRLTGKVILGYMIFLGGPLVIGSK